jgi:hypothetical protein
VNGFFQGARRDRFLATLNCQISRQTHILRFKRECRRLSGAEVPQMSLADVPKPIAAFFRGLAVKDRAALLAALAPDAALTENETEHSGAEAVCEWLLGLPAASVVADPVVVSTPKGSTIMTLTPRRNDAATNLSEGAHVSWSFIVVSDKICAITVGYEQRPDIPEPVAAFIRATNGGELKALVETFADHALVNDQLREHWDKRAITEWAAGEVIEQRLTVHVRKVVTNRDQIVVTANLDGTFDKRGLPDPLVVALYFSIREDKIVQLLILRLDPDA